MIQYMLNITSSSLSSKRNMYFLHVHCTFVRYFSNSPVKNKLKGTPVYQWLLIDLWVGNSEQRKKVCSHFEKQTGFSKGVTPPWVTHSSTWGRRCLTAVASYIAISHLCHAHFLGGDIDGLYLTTTFYRHLARPFLSLWTFFVSPVLPLLGLLLLVALMLLWTPLCPPTPPPVPVWAGEGAEGAPVPALPPPPPPGATARSDREDPLLDPSLSSWKRNCKAKWLSDSYLGQRRSFTVVSIHLNQTLL